MSLTTCRHCSRIVEASEEAGAGRDFLCPICYFAKGIRLDCFGNRLPDEPSRPIPPHLDPDR